MSNKKLAICVPYRNREEHLKRFIPHMEEYFKGKDIEYKIFICHQADNKEFNRGKLKNVAFDIAQKEGFEYFAFHDIDLLPEDGSADYSYPEKYPVHLSSRLSGYDYSLPYDQNFGGVVLFSKEQFENVNGYYNEYWDWGMEDDDLFWRCKINGYTNKEYYKKNILKHKCAKFNGKNSSIKIPESEKVYNAINGSYSISFLVKPEYRIDVPSYLIGSHYDAKYPGIPLFSLNGYPILVYDNRNSYLGWARIGNFGELVYVDRDRAEWTYVTFVINKEKNEVSLYVNDGIEESFKLTKTFNGELINYEQEFIIGSNCLTPVLKEWILDDLHFKGHISEFRLWNRAITSTDVKNMCMDGFYNLNKNGLIVHYDFTHIEDNIVKDMSNNNNDGKMKNITIEDVSVGPILASEKPYRRDGKYLSLKHDTEGIIDFKFVKGELSKKNEKLFITEVQTGLINTKENGLNNLEYSIKKIDNNYMNHVMVDVLL